VSARDGAALLTPGEVAGLFQVDPQTVTRWGASGRLLSSRTPGGQRRYFAAEVAALLRGETRERARELALAERNRLFRDGS
jgi:DNA-binding transcriptional MerR regulator